MAKLTMTNNTKQADLVLYNFFKDELKDIYWAENHLVKELPKMAGAATNREVKKAFTDHLRETKGQVKRLEKIFKMVGAKAQGKKCEAMEGITKECKSMIEDTDKGTNTRDVALIMGAQKVEHYEIATYGSLSSLAQAMGREDLSKILEETLTEERGADNLLSRIAVFNINQRASNEKKSGN